MTHQEVVEIGAKFLKKKWCKVVLSEMKCVNKEIADIVGFNSSTSFLLEAKVSRSDFLVDKKKSFRVNAEEGIGDFRFYIAPKGLIKVEELPLMWGLLEISEKTKVEETFNPFGKGNVYSAWNRHKKNKDAEWSLMYSALRRK